MFYLVIGLLLTIASNTAFATTSQQQVEINMDVAPACQISFNVPNVSLQLLIGQTNNALTTLTIDCTPQTNVEVTTTSANNWNLKGNVHQALIPYILEYTGGGYTNGATINPTWSGQVSNTIIMSGITQEIAWQIPLRISVNNLTLKNIADTYSDSVTIIVSY